MGRLEKLNNDIQELANKILDNQDICKLIYYPSNNPLEQPAVNGKQYILDERLLTFTPKLPLAEDTGTYVSIRTPRLKPTKDDYYIVSMLCFDVYCHKDIRSIYYKDSKGDFKKGDRAILILDKIENTMKDIELSVGKNKLDAISEIANSNAIFSGYTAGYIDVDFRHRSKN